MDILVPVPGSVLQPTFTASGTGGGLFEGNLVVRAQTVAGAVLAERPTTLQGPSVGTGGSGTWQVSLTVNVAGGTQGFIVAFAPGSPTVLDYVPVTYGSAPQPPSTKTFAPGECVIQGMPGAPYYVVMPGGLVPGQFVTGGTYNAVQGYRADGQYWYLIYLEPGTGNPPAWVPKTSTNSTSAGCTW